MKPRFLLAACLFLLMAARGFALGAELVHPEQRAAFEHLAGAAGLAAGPEISLSEMQSHVAAIAEKSLAQVEALQLEKNDGDRERLEQLAPVFADLSGVAELIPSSQDGRRLREGVIAAHHMLEIRARLARSREALEKEWSAPELESLARMKSDLSQEAAAALRPRGGALRSAWTFLQRALVFRRDSARALIDSHQIVGRLARIDRPKTLDQVYRVVGQSDLKQVALWRKALEDLIARSQPEAVLPFIEPVARAAASGALDRWPLGPDGEAEALHKPDFLHLELAQLRYAMEGGVDSLAALDRLLDRHIDARGSRDNLRTALGLMSARFKGLIADEFWGKILAQPPKNKHERKALAGVVRLLLAPESPAKITTSGAQINYDALNGELLARQMSRLEDKLGLSRQEKARVTQNPGFLAALGGDLLDDLLKLSSFSSPEKGLPAVKRLLLELSESPIEGGRIRYVKRYEALKGKVPEAVLARWSEDYEKEISPDPSAQTAEVDWSGHGRALKSLLGIESAAQMRQFQPKVSKLAASLRADPQNRPEAVAALETRFLPAFERLIEALEQGRAPPVEVIKDVMSVLARQRQPWAARLWPNSHEIVERAKAAAEALKPKQRPVDSRAARLVVTDDLERMLRCGNEPILTCQRTTEDTTHNGDGQPVARVLLGQMRLAQFWRGSHLVARAVVELARDYQGKPALLVNDLYHDPNGAPEWDAWFKAVMDYAKQTGVATVYFAKIDSVTGYGWKDIQGMGKKFSLFSDQGLSVYRDDFDEAAKADPISSLIPDFLSGAFDELVVAVKVSER